MTTENIQAPVAAAAKPVKTKRHAQHLLALALTRLVKAEAVVAGEKAAVARYEELVATLPEDAARPNTVYPVGAVVPAEVGRGESRRQVEGTIVAVKLNEQGAASQYRISVGVGFEAELINIYPAQIKGVVSGSRDLFDNPADEEDDVGDSDALGKEYEDVIGSSDPVEYRDPFAQ